MSDTTVANSLGLVKRTASIELAHIPNDSTGTTTFPRSDTSIAYLSYVKKQDALDTILDLETSHEWLTILTDYGRWLENSFTDTMG